ncbi:MAG: aminotransferase class I/II-fold pyridoxal phosphate-dependent enzyme [Patescibacteria group bacterium]|jgi:histidinol-phosphate/aromatic aminotransferase/cobyric acid decarboxylase-like protein/choline kinase|nr:aminotransferase class I/II-fold pyridoxal phosphate-dependent enzyme [Patescibacteria group bacterium]
MQALILAAGQGNRLKPMTDKIPKGLVQVNGIPILENDLNILSKKGIAKTFIVVGYLQDEIKNHFGYDWNGMKIEYLENKIFDQTNNIYSLWLAKDVLHDDTILMECDIFFEEKLIDILISEKLEDRVVVDRFEPFMDGTVVTINDHSEITKLITSDDQGENFDFSNTYKTVNIYLFTKDFLEKFFVPNLDLYVSTQGKNKYYELILSIFINFRNPVLKAAVISGVKWMEVDDFSDLRRAEMMFANPQTRLDAALNTHGGFWRYDFMDFSYLYNWYFPPLSLINEIRVNLPSLLAIYPSSQNSVSRILSNWLGIEDKYLATANGSSEIINYVTRTLVKKMLIPVPTFNEYERLLTAEQIVKFDTSKNNFDLDEQEVVDLARREGCNSIVLVNPNNPTGKFMPLAEIKSLVKKLNFLDLIIVDESFIDYTSLDKSQSMHSVFGEFSNLLIVKSMGKDLGLLGLRLGYALSANIDLINEIRINLPIWNVNSIAEYTLESLTKYRKEFVKSIALMNDDRQYLMNQLQNVGGLEPIESYTNFITCRIKGNVSSTELRDQLFLKHNIFIKDCSNKSGMADQKYVRFGVRKKADVDLLIKALKKELSDGK